MSLPYCATAACSTAANPTLYCHALCRPCRASILYHNASACSVEIMRVIPPLWRYIGMQHRAHAKHPCAESACSIAAVLNTLAPTVISWHGEHVGISIQSLLRAPQSSTLNLGASVPLVTSEAVSIVSALGIRESRLVSKLEDGFNTRQGSSTTFPRGDDGITDAAISQPARVAGIQPCTPGCI